MSARRAPAAAATTGAARRFTVWSLAVTAASLPLYVVRWHYGPLPTTLLETLILITVAGYAVTLYTEKRLPERTPFDVLIALWLVAGAIGVLAAPGLRAAAGTYRAYFIEAVAMYYVAVGVLRTRDDLRKLFLLTGTSAIVYSIGQVVSFVWVGIHGQLQLGDAPAFLNQTPNADAMYLEPILAFALAFVAFPWSKRVRVIAAVVLGFVFLAILLTLSRAGYLAMAVLAAVVVVSQQRGRVRLWIVGGLALALLAIVSVPFINHRLITIGQSAALRLSIWGQALHVIRNNPIFGAGIDGFQIRVAPYRPGTQTVEIYPHDIWLTTWSEVGLLGVLTLAVLAVMLLWRAARALAYADDVYRPVIWGCFGAFVLIFTHGFFDSPLWKNDLSVEFWLVVALEAVSLRAIASRGPTSPSPGTP